MVWCKYMCDEVWRCQRTWYGASTCGVGCVSAHGMVQVRVNMWWDASTCEHVVGCKYTRTHVGWVASKLDSGLRWWRRAVGVAQGRKGLEGAIAYLV